VLDPDGAYRDEEAQHESRELHYATARDGMLVIKARLDRETGAKFVEALRPLSAPRPDNDGEKDPRTAGQRHADGLAAMVDIVLDSDQMPRTGGQRPHLTVTIDFDDLKRRLLDGEGMPGILNATEGSVTAENIRRIACDCEVLPVVLGGAPRPPTSAPRSSSGMVRVPSPAATGRPEHPRPTTFNTGSTEDPPNCPT
jgi:hypothetical protein